ncbi:Pkinase-domain-containing protein [Clavulina sp. PMI_390]|nr:Pkinase-domain-containing protein [Clavulina sp. PMI_390]
MPKTNYMMGRDENADFVIGVGKVSLDHCSISYDPENDIPWPFVKVNDKLIGEGKLEVIRGSPEITLGRSRNKSDGTIRFIFRPASDTNPEGEGGGLYEKYQQLEELGSGSFGVVHRVHDRITGELAAVKAFRKRQVRPSVGVDIVHNREIDIMVKLRHSNIVTFYDYYHDHEKFYIVMEFVDGGNLQEYVYIQPERHMGTIFCII